MTGIPLPTNFSGRKFHAAFDRMPKVIEGHVVNAPDDYTGDLSEMTATAEDVDRVADDQWVDDRWPARRLLRLLYQVCKSIPKDDRRPLMNEFIDDVDNARSKRRGGA